MQGVILSAGSAQGLILGDDGERYPFTPLGWADQSASPQTGMRVDFEVRGSQAVGIHPIQGAAPPPSPIQPTPVPPTMQGAPTGRPPSQALPPTQIAGAPPPTPPTAQGTPLAQTPPPPPPTSRGFRMKGWYWAIAGGGALVILGVVGAYVLGVFPTSDPHTKNEVARQTPTETATTDAGSSQLDDGGSESEQLAESGSNDSETDSKPADYERVYQVNYALMYSQRYDQLYYEQLDRLGTDKLTQKQQSHFDKYATRAAEKYATAYAEKFAMGRSIPFSEKYAEVITSGGHSREWAAAYAEVYVTTGSKKDANAFANRIENGELKDYSKQLDSGKSHKYALAYAQQIENGNSSEYAAAYAQQIEDGNSEQDAAAYARQIEDGDSEEYAHSQEFKLEWETSATDIEAGESFTLTVRMYDVQEPGEHGGITVSFPSLTQEGSSRDRHSSSVAEVEAVEYTSGLSKVTFHQPGVTIYHRENNRQFSAEYLLVESDDASWSRSDDRTLVLRITPKRAGEFPTQIRGWLCKDEYTDCSRNPTEGVETDQQGWVVKQVSVKVAAGSGSAPKYAPKVVGRISFVSNRDGNREIYVMNADGSGQTRLTNNTESDRDPSWSPDGRRIAFSLYGFTHRVESQGGESYRASYGNLEIYVMNADGSGHTRLTNNTEGDWDPSWSPDGQRIVFSSDRDGNSEICVMNADGSGQTRLTNNTEGDRDPSWSPDGRRIAFKSSRDGKSEIYVMNADGSSQTRLTNNTEGDWDPSWSPDGRRIAFTSSRDGKSEIYVMNADGSSQTRLTNNTDADWDSSWSPDGQRIVFSSDRDGDHEIYIMNADGSDVRQLTHNEVEDGWPSWSPR